MKKKLIFGSLLMNLGLLNAQSSSYNGNTAHGSGITGTDCSAFGWDVLWGSPNSAMGNTGFGVDALYWNKTGESNTAAGNEALHDNISGNLNSAAGHRALYSNNAGGSGGQQNTAIGHTALFMNVDGSENTAIGMEALYNNSGGGENTADGYRALYYNSGSAGNYGEKNTAAGFAAMYGTYDGDKNTGIGYGSLYNNGPGMYNTAIGAGAAQFPYNYSSTWNNDNNTAVGWAALNGALTTYQGSYNNTSCGSGAHFYCADGVDNTAFGYYAHQQNDTGQENVALGSSSLKNSQSSSQNVALGADALFYHVSTDGRNTAIGYQAGYYTQTEDNVAVGAYAFSYNNADKQNTIIGSGADVGGNFHNTSALGAGALTTQNDMVRIGNSAVTSIACAVNYAYASDSRFKFNVNEKDVVGLNFIKQLKPVAYDFDAQKLEEFRLQNLPDSIRKRHPSFDFAKPGEVRHSGFLAQEMEEAMNGSGYNFNGLKKPGHDKDAYAVSYGLLVVPLVKAIQEEQHALEATRQSNSKLAQEIDTRDKIIAGLKNENTGTDLQTKNPSCNGICTISYKVPQNSTQASVNLYDLTGKEVTTIVLHEKGQATVSLNANDIHPGIYVYSILADGEIIDSQTIIISAK